MKNYIECLKIIKRVINGLNNSDRERLIKDSLNYFKREQTMINYAKEANKLIKGKSK